jgi:hypothetical protein
LSGFSTVTRATAHQVEQLDGIHSPVAPVQHKHITSGSGSSRSSSSLHCVLAPYCSLLFSPPRGAGLQLGVVLMRCRVACWLLCILCVCRFGLAAKVRKGCASIVQFQLLYQLTPKKLHQPAQQRTSAHIRASNISGSLLD